MSNNKNSFELYNILKKFYEEDQKNIQEIIDAGYDYDSELSFLDSVVYFDNNNKKLILIINGTDEENFKLLLLNNGFMGFIKFYKNIFIDRKKKIEKLFINIKNKYSGYKKICLGYSIAGYYCSEFIDIDDTFEKYYIFSGAFTIKNDKIINYVFETDIFSRLTSYEYNIVNSNILNLLVFKSDIHEWITEFVNKNHAFGSLDNSNININIKF
jgi:hypothetical protein